MKQKTTEIYIETRERLVFRTTSADEIEMVCPSCDSVSIFIRPERAALLFNLTAREVYNRIERDAVHFLETDSGATLVCAASLSDRQPELTNHDSQEPTDLYDSPVKP